MQWFTTRISRPLLAAGAVTLLCAGAVQAQTIVNPSFEADAVPGFPGYLTGEITGWHSSVATHGINDAAGPFYDPSVNGPVPDGEKVAFVQMSDSSHVFDSKPGDGLSGLTVGDPYTFSFFTNARDGNEAPMQIEALLDYGSGFTTVVPLTDVEVTPEFVELSAPFVAQGTDAAIRFSITTSMNDETILLDHVTVTLIPEPTSLGLLGLGGLGLLRRRRA